MIKIFRGTKLLSSLGYGQYDGEKIPGDLDQWNVLSSDSNELLTATYGYLARRSMTLYHTYPLARAAVNKQVDYAVGPGLAFRSQPDYQMLGMDRESAKDWGKDFQKIVHYYMQKFSLYEAQAVIMRGAMTYGDSLVHFIRENGMIQDVIEFSGGQVMWEYNDDNHTLGIKHDDYQRRIGFQKYDGKSVNFQDAAGNQDFIQYFHKELPRQMRGYPLIYSIINLAKNDDRHTDAIVHRAVMESIILGSYESDTTDPIKQTSNMASANLKKYQRDPNASLLSKISNAFKLGAGNMYTMRKGEKVSFTDLKTPSDNFSAFKTVIAEYIGAATGTPPEVILSKYSTSYTAHRGAFNDFIKSYTAKRIEFSRRVMNVIVREIAKDAIINGYIQAPGFFDNPMRRQAYLQGTYLGPVPGAINPLQEVNADVKRADNAFTLRSDISAQYGNEWDNFITEWGSEQDEFYSLHPEKRVELLGQEIAGQETVE